MVLCLSVPIKAWLTIILGMWMNFSRVGHNFKRCVQTFKRDGQTFRNCGLTFKRDDKHLKIVDQRLRGMTNI